MKALTLTIFLFLGLFVYQSAGTKQQEKSSETLSWKKTHKAPVKEVVSIQKKNLAPSIQQVQSSKDIPTFKHIKEIDQVIKDEQLIERANDDQLNKKERELLASLLKERNHLMITIAQKALQE